MATDLNIISKTYLFLAFYFRQIGILKKSVNIMMDLTGHAMKRKNSNMTLMLLKLQKKHYFSKLNLRVLRVTKSAPPSTLRLLIRMCFDFVGIG
jgi:hypothetical protein